MWLDSGLCRLCLVNSRAMDLVRLGREDLLPRMLVRIAEILEAGAGRTRAFVDSFEAVKELTGLRDPYASWKRRLQSLGLSIASSLKPSSVREALELSASANAVDTHVLGYAPLPLGEALRDKPVWLDEVPLDSHSRVNIVLDNAGEAAVDAVLARILAEKGYSVSLYVRSESYEIDVTAGEVQPESGVEVVETPGSEPPVLHARHGLTLAKGIANAEAALEHPDTDCFLLFRAKCPVLASILQVPRGTPVIVRASTLRKLASALRAGRSSPQPY